MRLFSKILSLMRIRSLLYYARLPGSKRFVSTLLLMLLLSQLQFVGVKQASASLAGKARQRVVRMPGVPESAAVSEEDRTDPDRLDAINKVFHTSFFNHLNPGIVMVPRMNRTPKPRSVYRLFTRAPGECFSSVPRCADCVMM